MISKYNSKAVLFSAIAVATAMFLPLANAQTPMSGGMDMKAMMKDGNDKMSSMAMTGNADVDFAMMMKIHHQGAIDMAQAELKNGKEPQMRKMAQSIIAAQKKEIAQFDKFLAKHGHPADKMSK
ncbi:MAG: DUF305 domain-containing protein [Pseudomonadota bacterium]